MILFSEVYLLIGLVVGLLFFAFYAGRKGPPYWGRVLGSAVAGLVWPWFLFLIAVHLWHR